jgi:hypothetical protein
LGAIAPKFSKSDLLTLSWVGCIFDEAYQKTRGRSFPISEISDPGYFGVWPIVLLSKISNYAFDAATWDYSAALVNLKVYPELVYEGHDIRGEGALGAKSSL